MNTTGQTAGVFSWALLVASGIFLLAFCLLLGLDAGSFAVWAWSAIGLGVGGGLLVAATALVWRKMQVGFPWLLLVLLCAVAFRLVLWSSDRYLSDDAYRYHWDGKIISAGTNPYSIPPNDPSLDHLRTDPIDDRINHPEVRTVYPPLAQFLFFLGYNLSPGSLTGFKLVLLLCELAAWGLLLWELHRRRLSKSWILLAAWSPLVLTEGYLPAHLDPVALPFLAWLIVALGQRQTLLAGLALALVCLVKPLGVIFVPAAMMALGFRGSLRAGLVFVLVVTAAYLPFWSAGWHLFSSMWLMAKQWQFNGSLAPVLETFLSGAPARWTAATILSGLLAASIFLSRDLISRLLLASAAFVICSTTLFPWYLIWLLPLLVLRSDPALLWLVITTPITEMVVIGYRVGDSWHLPVWVSLVQYVPFYLLLVAGAIHRWGMFQSPENHSRSLAPNT
jgi:alpha-1,6-mannosyltransferase